MIRGEVEDAMLRMFGRGVSNVSLSGALARSCYGQGNSGLDLFCRRNGLIWKEDKKRDVFVLERKKEKEVEG